MASSAVRIAAPRKQRITPAFMVKKLEGKRKVTLHVFDEKGQRGTQEVEWPAGYLVTMAKGHSIRVKDDKQLIALGFDQTIPLVDMETGDSVGDIPNDILEGDE